MTRRLYPWQRKKVGELTVGEFLKAQTRLADEAKRLEQLLRLRIMGDQLRAEIAVDSIRMWGFCPKSDSGAHRFPPDGIVVRCVHCNRDRAAIEAEPRGL